MARGSFRGALLSVCLTAGLTTQPALCGAPDHSASTVALVAKVIPTVVSIRTMRALPRGVSDPMQAGLATSVLEADSSGFVVDPAGYIATNRHVIDGAYAVRVRFADGRAYAAKVVWVSPVVDVAFLKVEAGRPLPAARLASDQDLRLGQRVIAIGNPLGNRISVSSGIVSALHRNIKQSPYDDFIQTDAAINHGSSGGPLFDEGGDVVGMNTALFAAVPNGGSEGLGFAIPGGDLTFLIDQIKRNHGRIRSGTLGVHGQTLTVPMAEALGYPNPYGVIVAAVDPGSPAERAGLKVGDIIGTFAGQTLFDITTLNRAVCRALDQHVAMDVWREGAAMSVSADIVEMSNAADGLPLQQAAPAPRFANANDLGMTLAPIDDGLRRRYALPGSATGLVVTAVSPSSQADVAGLKPGDTIASVQMTPLSATAPFDEMLVRYASSGHHYVVVLVRSGGVGRWLALPVSL